MILGFLNDSNNIKDNIYTNSNIVHINDITILETQLIIVFF